jgi:hypothetical protein
MTQRIVVYVSGILHTCDAAAAAAAAQLVKVDGRGVKSIEYLSSLLLGGTSTLILESTTRFALSLTGLHDSSGN